MGVHTLREFLRRLGPGDRSRLVPDGGQSDEEGTGGDAPAARGDQDGTADEEAEADAGGDGDTGTRPGADDEDDGEDGDEEPGTGVSAIEGENVEITDAGEADPAEPRWEEPDLDELPDFQLRADQPVASGGSGGADAAGAPGADGDTEPADFDAVGADAPDAGTSDADEPDDPTAGMPNTARAPGASRISSEGTEAYVVALELCARLPDDVRLPDEAADLVPAAVEAELEQDIQAFAAAEFDNEQPAVDTLTFEEVDDEVWLRIRIGVPAGAFADLDPDAIRSYALQRLEGVF